MIATDKNALICDLAETYGVFDMEGLPVHIIATLAVGLRENSRIKMKLAGEKVSLEKTMLAVIADRLGLLVWFQTEDGEKGVNRPKSILSLLYEENEINSDIQAFDSAEEFEAERERIIKHITEG